MISFSVFTSEALLEKFLSSRVKFATTFLRDLGTGRHSINTQDVQKPCCRLTERRALGALFRYDAHIRNKNWVRTWVPPLGGEVAGCRYAKTRGRGDRRPAVSAGNLFLRWAESVTHKDRFLACGKHGSGAFEWKAFEKYLECDLIQWYASCNVGPTKPGDGGKPLSG